MVNIVGFDHIFKMSVVESLSVTENPFNMLDIKKSCVTVTNKYSHNGDLMAPIATACYEFCEDNFQILFGKFTFDFTIIVYSIIIDS